MTAADLDLTAAIEALARELACLEPGEDWPTNEALGGSLTGTRDDEYRAAMHEQAADHLKVVAPLIAAQVAEQIARAIERGENWTPEGPFSCSGCPVCDDLWESEPTCTHHAAIEWAARIAREWSPR